MPLPPPGALRALAVCLLGWAALAAPGLELNRANQAELEMIKGVGPQLSERILAERERGPFQDWPEFIRRLQGIGPHQARRLSEAGLRIGGQPYPPASASAVAR